MENKLPFVITKEHVSSFLNNYGPLVDVGIIVAGAKIMQKVAPDAFDALLVSVANTLKDKNEMISPNKKIRY